MIKSTVEYYLGSLGIADSSSKQEKLLREIILSNKSENEILLDFEKFILSQNQLSSDTILIIKRSLLCGYSYEDCGLGGDDNVFKSQLFLRFINHFPNIPNFKFDYAECCMMNNQPVEDYFSILKEGMMQDKEHKFYFTSELICSIHESSFSFEFDILLLEKYYQPCDKESFDEYVQEFKEIYKSEEQQKCLNNLKQNL